METTHILIALLVVIAFVIHSLVGMVKAVGQDLTEEFRTLRTTIERSTDEITAAITKTNLTLDQLPRDVCAAWDARLARIDREQQERHRL